MTDDAVTDFPGATDEDAAVRLAHGRQWIAHQGVSYVPPWDGLTHAERDQTTTEARHWLMAAVNVGLLPPPRELECPSCRTVISARAVPVPAVDREALAGAVHEVRHKGLRCLPAPTVLDYEIADALISAGLLRGTGNDEEAPRD